MSDFHYVGIPILPDDLDFITVRIIEEGLELDVFEELAKAARKSGCEYIETGPPDEEGTKFYFAVKQEGGKKQALRELQQRTKKAMSLMGLKARNPEAFELAKDWKKTIKRKERLVADIRLGLLVLGKTPEHINNKTKRYFEKTVAELEPLWADIEKRLKAAGKYR